MVPKQLVVSIISDGDSAQRLADFGIDAQIVTMHWQTYWRDLLNIALFKEGADVSQIGAPSTGSVVAMNALRPFSRPEINAMGGKDAFLPVCWQSTQVPGDTNVWAIPFYADARVIVYWRDMLEEAGIEEESAFDTAEHLEATLARLQAKGFDTPWGIDTISQFTNLQNVVSWVWGAGGSILSADGRQPLFCERDAIRGIQQYFELHKYLPAKLCRGGHSMSSPEIFLNREVAVAMWNPNWRTLNTRYAETPEVLERIGAAQPPGPAYIGGSNLLLWSHSRHQADAVELVQKLTSKEVHEYLIADGVLPARKDILAEPPYTTDPHLKVMVEALNTGRSYPNFRRWGVVEERLGMAFIKIWGEVFENDGKDIGKILERDLGSLCRRLETTLSEY